MMTIDDLKALFQKAKAATRPYINGNDNGDRAGIRAVVEALRDEMTLGWEDDRPWGDVADVKKFLNKILASDGEEKAAGGSAREDEPGGVEQAVPALTPATDAAPEVCTSCYGTGEDTVMERRCHCQPLDTTTTRCPDCNGEGCTPQVDRRGGVYAEPCPRCETTGRVPITAAAPVCVWTRIDEDVLESGCDPDGWTYNPEIKRDTCPQCGKPIAFTEAK